MVGYRKTDSLISSELYLYVPCVKNCGGWDKRTEKEKSCLGDSGWEQAIKTS